MNPDSGQVLSLLRPGRVIFKSGAALTDTVPYAFSRINMASFIPATISRKMSALLDLVYPPLCEGCDTSLPPERESMGKWLCSECLASLPRVKEPFCSTCGEPFDGDITDSFTCGNCRTQTLHFDFAISSFMADGLPRQLIHRFKYQRQIHLRGLLGHMLEGVFQDSRLISILQEKAKWLLVPVPLHPWRLWRREFNQSWELSRQLSQLTQIPTRNILARQRATSSQARLSRHQRLKNLKTAFKLRRSALGDSALKGKNILLVDDVLTTGATANECARVLKRQGKVEKVVVITATRG